MSNINPRPLRYFIQLILLLVAMAAIIVYYLYAGDETAQSAAHEGGPIDLSSALGYFLCAALMLWKGGNHVREHHWPLIVGVTLLGLRELDMDKRYSTFGLFKSQTFRSPDVSWLEKGVSVLIVLAVAWLLVLTTKRYIKPLLLGALRFEAVAIIAGVSCGMLFIARLLDGIARKLAVWNISFSEHQEILTTIAEEVLELGAPLGFILAFFAYYRIYHPRGRTQT